MNIIFLGAPGSGKGTQSEQLIAKHGLQHLSTGDMLRAEIMDAGELVSDDIVIGMIAKRLSDKGALFDGFPRTLAQAQALDALLAENAQQIDHVVFLDVDNEEIVQRMLARGRADDNEATIRNRINVFEQQTKPLIDFYREQGKLREIHGKGGVEEIAARIEQAIL